MSKEEINEESVNILSSTGVLIILVNGKEYLILVREEEDKEIIALSISMDFLIKDLDKFIKGSKEELGNVMVV